MALQISWKCGLLNLAFGLLFGLSVPQYPGRLLRIQGTSLQVGPAVLSYDRSIEVCCRVRGNSFLRTLIVRTDPDNTATLVVEDRSKLPTEVWEKLGPGGLTEQFPGRTIGGTGRLPEQALHSSSAYVEVEASQACAKFGDTADGVTYKLTWEKLEERGGITLAVRPLFLKWAPWTACVLLGAAGWLWSLINAWRKGSALRDILAWTAIPGVLGGLAVGGFASGSQRWLSIAAGAVPLSVVYLGVVALRTIRKRGRS